jgi:Tol biopolymer transport system component
VLLVLVGLLSTGCEFIARASVDRSGGDSNGSSVGPFLSADGRYVAFRSVASDLVPGDGNARSDVFVRDLRAGTTTRVSVDTAGGDPNGESDGGWISADGRYIGFYSFASDLVPGDGNGVADVFVRDRQAGTTTRVSADTAGGDANDGSFGGSISADGRSVAFHSFASDLVADDGTMGPGGRDVFVRDLQTGTTTRASVDTSGGDPNDISANPVVSADGRHVAFYSYASDLVPGDGTVGFLGADVFVRDLQTGVTTRASVDTSGGDPNDHSPAAPSISADGRYVAFQSFASDLVPGDGNDQPDVFVRDMQAATTTRVSADMTGGDANDDCGEPSMSADGRYVAFRSVADDIVPGDTNGQVDVFVRDMQTNATARVSTDVFDRQANGHSFAPSISADGRYVAFDSVASNLVGGDGNQAYDVFVRAFGEPTVESLAPAEITRGVSATLRIVGNGFLPGTQVSMNTFGTSGVTVTSVNVLSETQLEVSVTVDPLATIGERHVIVWNPGTGPGELATGFGVCFGCLTVT